MNVTDQCQTREEALIPMNQIFNAKNITKIGTWNVRTLCQSGRLAQVLREMEAYGLDVLGISEVRWTGQGQTTNNGVTILYSGRENTHTHGVGILLSRKATDALIGWTPVNHRIITARLRTRHAKITIVQAYAPTENAQATEKDNFYSQLQDTLDNTPKYDIKLLIGDFNAKLGSEERQGLQCTIGPHGTANKTNDNGERLIFVCRNNAMNIGNTFFKHKTIHKKTWRSPDNTTQNEIDYICTSNKWRSSLRDVHVYRGTDIGSDHHLLIGKVQIRLKRTIKTPPIRPIVVEKLKDRKIAEEF